MIELIKPNLVVGPDFEVERINKDYITYKSRNHKVSIEVESGYRPEYYIAIYLSAIKLWESPNNNKIISDMEIEKMRKDIKVSFDLMDTAISFE